MNWQVICLIFLLITVSLSACGSVEDSRAPTAPTAAKVTSRDAMMPEDRTMSVKMDGEATVKQGETMMQQGKTMMQDKVKTQEGQAMIQKGEAMIQKGEAMIQSSATKPQP